MLTSNRQPLHALVSRPALAVVLGAAVLTGCGSASTSSSTASATAQTSATSTTAPATTNPPSQSQGKATVSTGPVQGTLRGENHAPKVNRNWPYSVAVSDASGRPLNGTVDIEFAYGGEVVGHDTPRTHPVLDGRWHDSLKFPAAAVGMPLSVRAVVHTTRGSITLDWPITVRS